MALKVETVRGAHPMLAAPAIGPTVQERPAMPTLNAAAQAERHVNGLRHIVLGLPHRVPLRTRHVAHFDRAPFRYVR